MLEKSKFLQGVFSFEGRGLQVPQTLNPPLTYRVPSDKRAQAIYFRAGNSSDEMIYLQINRDNKRMRYFPVGAKNAVHVPLAVVEDLHPDTVLELLIAAPAGSTGSVVIDFGLAEF